MQYVTEDVLYDLKDVLENNELSYEDQVRTIRTWLDNLPVAPEPDWSKAPEEYQYFAICADGETKFFISEPERDDFVGSWWQHRNDELPKFDRNTLPLGIDWRDTLRKRPKEA